MASGRRTYEHAIREFVAWYCSEPRLAFNRITDLLPRVEVPTLVLHSRGDARVPFEHGLMLARAIPDARFVALESKNHLILSPEPAWARYIDEISGFLAAEECGR